MQKISDSHFHSLLLKDFDKEKIANNLYKAIDVPVESRDCEKIIQRWQDTDNIFVSIGASPWSASEISDLNEYSLYLKKLCQNKKVVFIGEIGLDYSKNIDKNKQIELFEMQLSLAKELNIPPMLHIRDAFDDTYDILKANYIQGGVVHCFSSNKDDAKCFLDLGFCLSFSGKITYKSNYELCDAVEYSPLDRILVETDSPFLTPQQHRGEMNNPFNVLFVAQMVSQIKKIQLEQILEITNSTLDKYAHNRE